MADKILLAELQNFNWDLAQEFLYLYHRRCRARSYMAWMKYTVAQKDFPQDRFLILKHDYNKIKDNIVSAIELLKTSKEAANKEKEQIQELTKKKRRSTLEIRKKSLITEVQEKMPEF